jgi:hypothetical protein
VAALSMSAAALLFGETLAAAVVALIFGRYLPGEFHQPVVPGARCVIFYPVRTQDSDTSPE